jgi:ParB family chromosome partitioning protein
MNAPAAVTDEYRVIPLDQLRESPSNPRRHYDKAADAELANSIKSQGIVQPLVVRAAPAASGRQWEIVAGTRRYRQAKVAGLAAVPAMVRRLTDAQVMEIQIVENLQRQDIHPFDEAFGYQQLLKQKTNGQRPYDVAAIAARVGKSVSYVYMRMKLMDLVATAQEALLADQITAGHAEKIARLQPKDQKDALKQCLDKYDPASVRDLADWIADNVHLDLATAPFKPGDATLVPSAKACTTCPKRTGTQPHLFPDIAQGDVCTDRACFKAKVSAHMARTLAEAKAAGQEIVRISTSYRRERGDGVLNSDAYRLASPKCPSAKLGLIAEAPRHEKEKIGTVLAICTDRQCKVHWPTKYSSARAPLLKAAANHAAQQKRQAEEIATPRAVSAVLKAFDKKTRLELHDLRLVCESIWWNSGGVGDEIRLLASHHGLKRGAPIAKAFGRCKTVPQIVRWLFGLLLVDLLQNERRGEFDALARRHGVDVPKLRKTALSELQAKDRALAAGAKKSPASGSGPAKTTDNGKPQKRKLQTSAKSKAVHRAPRPRKARRARAKKTK